MKDDSEVQKGSKDRPGKFALTPDRIAFLFAIFLFGGIYNHLGLPPFPTLTKGFVDTVRFVQAKTISRPLLLQDITYEGNGLVANDPAAAQAGYTLVQGILPGGPQIRMLDMAGREVHRWDVDFFTAWQDPRHLEVLPVSKHWYNTQGFHPLPDGSVMVNVSDKGTVMLDKCSRPQWTVDEMTHHSVTVAGDGKYWLPSQISLDETPDRYFTELFPRSRIAEIMESGYMSYNNSIVLVGAGGAVEKRFSVLEAIFRTKDLEHAMTSALLALPKDPVHINDIEIVTPELAAKIAGVSQGDLLVSSRHMSLLVILDQNDGHLKWHRHGPWVWQHDPDIMPDGTIEIFSNRNHLTSPFVDSSQILSYDPATDEIRVLYPLAEGQSFYTFREGSHQRLDNGNILIAETMAGRIFEVTPGGETVWDFRLPYDDEKASMFEVGIRVPPDYFNVEDWACPGR